MGRSPTASNPCADAGCGVVLHEPCRGAGRSHVVLLRRTRLRRVHVACLLVRRQRHGRRQVPGREPYPALVCEPRFRSAGDLRHECRFRLLGGARGDRGALGARSARAQARSRPGFSAFRIDTGTDSQELASFTWDRGGVRISKVDAEAGSSEQGDASLEEPSSPSSTPLG